MEYTRNANERPRRRWVSLCLVPGPLLVSCAILLIGVFCYSSSSTLWSDDRVTRNEQEDDSGGIPAHSACIIEWVAGWWIATVRCHSHWWWRMRVVDTWVFDIEDAMPAERERAGDIQRHSFWPCSGERRACRAPNHNLFHSIGYVFT